MSVLNTLEMADKGEGFGSKVPCRDSHIYAHKHAGEKLYIFLLTAGWLYKYLVYASHKTQRSKSGRKMTGSKS